MPTEKFILYTDGGSRGNPGPAGAGMVLADANNQPLKKAHKALGIMTNNEAEYHALINGLELVKKTLGKVKAKQTTVEVRMDSELVVRQLNGEYQIKEAKLWPLFIKVWNIKVAEIPNLTFTHIPRAQNQLADDLANEAMDGSKQDKLI